jgi:UDPglucose 6-dehydrogenase
MKVIVFGLWHLGSVTAACLADVGHEVVGVDDDSDKIENLSYGLAPIFEPGLNELVKLGVERGNLKFKNLKEESFNNVQVVWVTYDTPVDDEDRADTEYVIKKIIYILPFLSQDTVVLISSQLPVGSISGLEKYAKQNLPLARIKFACSPENLRLGQAIKVFSDPDRIIVGVRCEETRRILTHLLDTITNKIEWMSTESAEMTKHAINAFLATSITFTNEIASICEQVGANAKEVERGLKTEGRIGSKAYVSPGGPFAGGTLARDVEFLTAIGGDTNLVLPILSSVRVSNDEHKNWARKKLVYHFGNIRDKTVAVWGLTYKPGTNTLRRSLSVELCDWILSEGGAINFFDPVVKELPMNLMGGITRSTSWKDALKGSDALIVATEWPELKEIASNMVATELRNIVVVDATGFLKATLAGKALKYYAVGEEIIEGSV